MLVQSHREYSKDEKDGCFAVGKSMEEIFEDLKQYCKNHPDSNIYYYVHPVRPSKENYRPEYMMEIECTNDEHYLMMCWNIAHFANYLNKL